MSVMLVCTSPSQYRVRDTTVKAVEGKINCSYFFLKGFVGESGKAGVLISENLGCLPSPNLCLSDFGCYVTLK